MVVSDSRRDNEIYADQVALLYDQARPACVITLLISLILVAIHWLTIPPLPLLGWLAAMTGIIIVRWLLVERYDASNPCADQVRCWGQYYLWSVSVTGLIWGSIALLWFPFQAFDQRVFAVVVLAGMIGGAIPLLAPVKSVAMSYAVTAGLPAAVALICEWDILPTTLGTMMLIYIAAMLGSIVRANRAVVQSLYLRRENAELLAKVTAEKASMEELNRQLRAAIAERETAENSLRETNRSLEQRVQARTLDLERLANYDALTRLPNRLLLKDRLQHAIATARRERAHIALLFIDLDHFKLINDSLGHDAGDELLQAVASHLQTCVRQSDTVARIGGDEFVIVLERLTVPDQAQNIADKILNLLKKPITIQGQAFFIGCSIGISRFPEDGGDPGLLLKHADIALQRAKTQGRNLFCCYTPSMHAEVEQRVGLETELRQALQTGALTLYYQPIIDLKMGTVSGLEALLRWLHPQRGLIPASMLIPLAEETGLIVPIGNQVLKSVCRQIKSWQAQGIDVPIVSVNLSARQFLQADLVEQIEIILAATDLSPSCIELEITETMLMQNVERACDILLALKKKGLLLAIDDFGTGYSSLNYLKRFPLDWLKIDKTFVRDIVADPDDAAIVTAVTVLAHNLGLKVVVEGVETEDQLRFVREHASDAAQGYFFSPPLPGDAIPDLLQRASFLPATAR